MKSIFTLFFITVLLSANSIPLINPTKVIISDEVRCVDEKNNIGCSDVYTAVDLTGIDWLDYFMLTNDIAQNKSNSISDTIKHIEQSDKQWLDEATKEIAQDQRTIGYSETTQITYLHQRYNIATLKAYYYSFSGGAHGNYNVSYIVADLASNKILSLEDILLPNKSEELANLLLQEYRYKYNDLGEDFLPQDSSEKLSRMLIDNFYFDDYGIKFIYNPYYVGPYSHGIIEIHLRCDQIRGIIKPEYIR